MTAVATPVASGPRSALLRWLRWVALGAVTALAAVIAMVAVSGDGSDGAGERRQVAREAASYKKQLKPLTDTGANVVISGLKPGFTDIREERYPAPVLTGMTDAWISDLEAVRDGIRALEHRDVLGSTHNLYLRALDGYVRVAMTLREAVAASGEDRQALLGKAASLGRGADRTYDRAEDALARLVAPVDQENERR